MSDLLENVRIEVAAHMDAIEALFKPGVKITVIVRTPDFPTRDFCMTNDNFNDVISLIERRRDGHD